MNLSKYNEQGIPHGAGVCIYSGYKYKYRKKAKIYNLNRYIRIYIVCA